jgi:hypothetical protein
MLFTQVTGLDLDSRFPRKRSTFTRLLHPRDVLQLKHIGLKCSFVFRVARAVYKFDFRLVINNI